MTVERIGKYRIEGILGQGAMGVVYRGHDASLDRPVAIKTIHAHLLGGAAGVQLLRRFRTEATAAARCQHANIVTVYDFGEHEGSPYIAMEFVSGRALDALLLEQPGLTLRRINTLVSGICRGLHYAHQRGIVHRDIKPANIMVLSGDAIKLADFGIARIPASDLTEAGFALGTPSYMAPEQRAGAEVDARADIFALGVVLFELLGACRDFPEALRRQPVKAVLALPASRKLDPGRLFPPSVASFLDQCLAPDPGQRLPGVERFVESYKAALKNLHSPEGADPDATRVADPTAVATVAEQEWRRRTLQALELRLAAYVGPIAAELVRSGYARTGELARLVDELAAEIPDATERRRFLRESAAASSSTWNEGGEPTALHPAQRLVLPAARRLALEKALAFHIGPMAAMVIESHLAAASGIDGLLQALAAEIPDDRERQQFLAAAQRATDHSQAG